MKKNFAPAISLATPAWPRTTFRSSRLTPDQACPPRVPQDESKQLALNTNNKIIILLYYYYYTFRCPSASEKELCASYIIGHASTTEDDFPKRPAHAWPNVPPQVPQDWSKQLALNNNNNIIVILIVYMLLYYYFIITILLFLLFYYNIIITILLLLSLYYYIIILLHY